jgi:hypothetical protein
VPEIVPIGLERGLPQLGVTDDGIAPVLEVSGDDKRLSFLLAEPLSRLNSASKSSRAAPCSLRVVVPKILSELALAPLALGHRSVLLARVLIADSF